MNQNLSLHTHEWLAIITICGILFFLTLVTQFNPYVLAPESVEPMQYIVAQEIDVYVEGAVQNPGVHHVSRNATMQDVLDVAIAASEADLRKINPHSKIRKGQLIKIPKREMITVELTGAVKEQKTVQMPKGSALEDLASLDLFLDEADLVKLQRKRRLKDGEVIDVKCKKTKK